GPGTRCDDRRRLRGRAGRLPVRQVRHRQPRHRRPRMDAARPRHRDRGRPRPSDRHQRVDGRTAGPPQPVPYRPRSLPQGPVISMDHRLSPELEELRRTVEEFAHDVVAPKIGDFYERHEFPYEIVREMGRMGLFGLPFPEEYGGMGGDYLALGIALEELAR